ncbi:MAG: hypothetical protein QOH69_1546 [Actinomycetota bacterium]|jgi:hypothetical protein|nr:hypothetical protein [Actinomycetota bacterium]
MIEWGSFLVVALGSLAGGCGVVLLFSLGLRFAGPETDGSRRGLGIACFTVCALVVALGVCLVIPYFAPFFARL